MYSYSQQQSNNPFVGDPSTAHARFPDISAAFNGYPTQHQQYPAQSFSPAPSYQAQPQLMAPQPTQSPYSYPAQYQGQVGPQPTGIGAYQQTAAFAQQYPANGYPAGFPQANATTPSYLPEFDPYAQTQAQTQPLAQSPAQPSIGPNGLSHPRDVIRVHKIGLEAWDTYSWKQLLDACDALKHAWSSRKQQADAVVRQYGGNSDPGLFGPDPAFGYNSQLEGWKQVLKDASNNFDTVAASTFQLHEVFNSYRHSADQASKRRVRESCNAAVKGLPDWPSN